MYIQDSTLNTLMNRLDNDTAKLVKDIVQRKITHQVFCLSKKCKGNLVGYIYSSQGRSYAEIHDIDAKKSGITRVRKRLDGEWGFECICGNSSIIAKAEEGLLPVGTVPGAHSLAPSREQLVRIDQNLNENPPNYKTDKGAREVDGFRIEQV